MDNIIVAVIMISMIIAALIGAFIATKKDTSGFISAVNYKQKREEDEQKK